MTPTARALLATVRDNPSDKIARKVYADAIEEAGDEEGAHLQRAIAEPHNDGHRFALADVLERTAGTVKLCVGMHRHDGEKFPLISGGVAWDAHGVIHRANPKQPHHHCDEKCRVSDGRKEWAAFIRVQCELATDQEPCNDWCNNGLNTCDECRNRDKLRARERELWPAVRGRFEGYGVEPCYQTGLMVHQPPDGEIVQRSTVLIRRGLPSVVRCTLAGWMGGECERCNSRGWYEREPGDGEMNCFSCRGTGRTTGIGPRLAQRWPIERVEVTDAVIHPSGGNSTYYVGGLGIFPKEFWRRLDGHRTPSDACAALSDALIQWARGQAIEDIK